MQTNTTQSQPKKLLDQVRDKIRFKHYSLSTENTYLSWIKQFILYHGKRYPSDMGAAEMETFLTYLATQHYVSSSKQNQALSAILFCIAKYWQLLGHSDVATTMIYTHVLNKGGKGVLSPLDQL
jgi:Phage integrase, N-terminal SAM-like domain